MAPYSKVADGEIVYSLPALPRSDANTSNLRALSPEALVALGWYRIVDDVPATGDLQSLTGPVLTVGDGQVDRVWGVEDDDTDTIKAKLQTATQNHLDTVAQAKDYADAERCVSYVGDPDTTFNDEAVALRDWRSAVWVYCIAELAKLEAATRAPPASTAAFMQELPAAPW